jgi:pSer/pThr/pTyr-binding forkhead associated (FHA) protein
MANGALKFKGHNVGRQPQELGRFRVLGGAEAGATYVITSPRVSIGRGEENEIAILDLKLSRKHAEITKTHQGLMIRDLGSSNGLAINGQVLKQWFLKTGDKVGMGSTVLEFIAPESLGQMTVLPPPVVSTNNVGSGLSGLTRFIARPKPAEAATSAPGTPKTGLGALLEKNKKATMLLMGLLALATLMPQAEMQVRKRRKKYEPPVDSTQAAVSLKSFLPQGAESEVKQRAEAYFKEGYREFIEKNYIRALASFEVALQVFPGHEMARIYKDNVLKAMEQDAMDLKRLAKRDELAGRYKTALNRYDQIRRMYFKDQSNPLYKEADEAHKKLEIKVKEIDKG